MDALARLDDFLVKYMDDIAPEELEKPKFTIETKEQVIWALRKIAAIERARKESQLAAQAEMDRIKNWLAEEERRADQAREYLDYLLEDYHRRQLVKNPKAKTIKLPHGELQLRAQQPEFTRDEVALMAWARENRPGFIIKPPLPEPMLDWAGLRKALKIVEGKAIDPLTGEVIPGITVTKRQSKFQIKLTGV